MFLVLCMVVTTLMGVMVADVSAASTADFKKTVVVTPATDTTMRKIEFRYGLAGLPAVKNTDRPLPESTSKFATGEWWAAGYKYDGVLNKDNVANLDSTGKYDMVKFAEVSVVDNPLDTLSGGKMSKISFKNATIKDDTFTANGSAGTLKNSAGKEVSKITANYLRFMLLGENLAANATTLSTSSAYSYEGVTNSELKTKITSAGGAYVYTMYAYTNKTTDQNTVEYQVLTGGSTTGSIELKSNYIYSEAGIPHKVQLVISGKSLASGSLFYHIYVDGVERAAGLASSKEITGTMTVMLRENMTLANRAAYTIKECDWYVTNTSSALMSPVFMTEEELKNELINVPKMYEATQSKTYRTDTYVTGVNADLATSIKAALETTETGDKYVEIPSTRYNRPETLFVGGADSSVELVDRTTGAVVDPVTATGTMDNYYLKVKGIYIIPVSVEVEAGTLELLGVSYNAREKVAQLAYSEYDAVDEDAYTFQLVVAAYDASGKVIELKASPSTTISGAGEDGEHKVTYNVPFSQNVVNVADHYKVFAFKSLVNAIPILPAGYTGNPYKESYFNDGQITKIVTTFIGDAKTSRGFAWSAGTEYKDMVVEYAPTGADWNTARKQADGYYEEYNGILYYKADVTGLTPGTEYTYRIGDASYNKWDTDRYTFTTEAENVTSFSFVGFTDSQSTTGADGFALYRQAIEASFTDAPDAKFMVMMGDLVNTGTNAGQWTNYFTTIDGYAQSIPHMAVVGNHELSGTAETAGKYFSLLFNNPDNAGNWVGTLKASDLELANNQGAIANYKDTVYSFDYGNTHFVVLNTGYHNSSTDTYKILEKQLPWLKEDLAKSNAKWKIVMLHQGLYGAKSQWSPTRGILQPIMDEYGVDLVLQGHDHFVMRTYPMRSGEIVTTENVNTITKGTGVVYNILGAAGPKRYDDVYEVKPYCAVFVRTSEEFPTYSVFKVSDDKIEVETKQINGVVVDKYTITE